MKPILIAALLLMIIGCSSSEENPVSGKVYVFKSVPDLPVAYDEKIIFEYLAFLDEESFILSYSEEYEHKFVRGSYYVTYPYVHLEFEKTAYDVSYPEVPATSAVDTNVYLPIIGESSWKYPELKMKFSIDSESIRLDKTGMEQKGKTETDISLEDFKTGIEIQNLEFLLEKDN